MKLRVRLAGAPDAPLMRADVDAALSIAAFSEQCRAHFANWLSSASPLPASSSTSPAALQFSLNKREPLMPAGDAAADAAASAPVSALGVTSGDLLWILDACGARASPAAAATTTTLGAAATTRMQQQPQQPAAPATAAPAPASSSAPPQEEMDDDDDKDAAKPPPPPPPPLPACLRRALSALPAARGASARAPPAALVAQAVHAAMLEAGFVPLEEDEQGHQQQQEQQPQQQPQQPKQRQQQPQQWRRRRRYRHGAGAADVSYPPVAAAGPGDAEVAEMAAESVGVEVRCVPLGGASVLVAGAVTAAGGGGGEGGGGGGNGGGTQGTAVVSLTLSVAEHVVAVGDDDKDDGDDDVEMEEAAAGTEGAPAAAAAAAAAAAGAAAEAAAPSSSSSAPPRHCFRSVPALWRALRDGLSAPLLLAHHRAAGLPPPAGLLALPADLLVREVLPRLVSGSGGAGAGVMGGAGALASCCLACSALRAAASADELWRPVFEAESAASPSGDPNEPSLRLAAERRGWQWAAACLVRERRRRERLLGLRLRRGPRAPLGPPGGGGGGPALAWFPRGYGPPGIVGGDYDRLPGGLGGGGRGGFGGGGFGGVGFGGGGGGGAFFTHGGGGGSAAGSAVPGPGPGPGGLPPLPGLGLRRGGAAGAARDFSLRH